jgi:hypothetical protein
MSDIVSVWQESLNVIKDRVTGRTIWETLDAIIPITSEEEVAVLGLPHEKSSQAGHLNSPTTRNIIEQVLSGRMEKRLTVRVIEGTTLKDWEHVKEREATARQLEQQSYVRHQTELSSTAIWDDLHDQCQRKFHDFTNRSLASVRGQYLIECINLIVETLQRVGEPDELASRNYSRVMERVAQNTDISSALVAYFVLERIR